MTAHIRFCIAIGFFAVIGQTSSIMCLNITLKDSRERQCCSGNMDFVTKCTCAYGWKDGSCEESLLCYIDFGASKVPPEGNVKDMPANSENQWKSFLRECQPECHSQMINDHQIHVIGNIRRTKYSLISNELECNTIVATNHQTISKTYIISGVAMLIIILLVMVVVTVYTVRRKRRTRHTMKNGPTELIYDDVGLRTMNSTYDEVLPPILEYDYVIEPPNRVCDEVLLVHYDDVNVQPIIVYDDVNVKSNQKFTTR